MKKALYSRERHVITNIETGEHRYFVKNGVVAINEAKRYSHNLQMSNDGALGRGSVVAVS